VHKKFPLIFRTLQTIASFSMYILWNFNRVALVIKEFLFYIFLIAQ